MFVICENVNEITVVTRTPCLLTVCFLKIPPKLLAQTLMCERPAPRDISPISHLSSRGANFWQNKPLMWFM